ncbi:MAG: tRNA (guanosine(37)-N1)-methyltransferase TrmD [Myxococcota bacterium]
MQIDVLTIFPELFGPFLETAFVAHARRQGALEARVHDLRAWTTDRHRKVDDAPYGGGAGMVMTPEPLVTAIEALAGPKGPGRRARVVYPSPQGERLTQAGLERLAGEAALLFVCGRYEGVDERVLELTVDLELSIGDYVLSGGELPAMVVIEGVVRLLPGVLGNPDSIETESFRGGDLLEGPHYTRPPIYRGLSVPEVLRSGDHAAIAAWRRRQAEVRTRMRRPDLIFGDPPAKPTRTERTTRTAEAAEAAEAARDEERE